MLTEAHLNNWWVVLTIDKKIIIFPDIMNLIGEINESLIEDKFKCQTTEDLMFSISNDFEKSQDRQIITESIEYLWNESQDLQNELYELDHEAEEEEEQDLYCPFNNPTNI